MSCSTEKIDINDLEEMLHEARKGRAKIDKQYVDYEEQGHLFEYKIDFNQFLEDVDFMLKAQNKKHKNDTTNN